MKVFLLIVFSWAFHAQANEVRTFHSFDFHQKIFTLKPGAACQIKRFTLENASLEIKNTETGTNTHFHSAGTVIDTTGPSCIQDYGVVQWIQGCVSNQEFDSRTQTLTPPYYGTLRTSRGIETYFDHPSLQVDSLNIDPLYASKGPSDAGPRLGWYYVSKTPLKLQNNQTALAADQKLFDQPSTRIFLENATSPTAQTYVTDLPEPAEYYSEAQYPVKLITNTSLRFQTCVYAVQDVPTTGDPLPPGTPAEIGGPLACFSWAHQFKFNPNTLNFTESNQRELDPFCLSPTPSEAHVGILSRLKTEP